MDAKPLRILMLSIHGLVRGREPELGRDADTGGQVKYVIELARALGVHPRVASVDLITRLIEDDDTGDDYKIAEEPINDHARIIRLPFGPARYLRKESLWSYLDQLVDRCLEYLRQQGRLPDVIHSHYGDAGYVGEQLSLLLGIPLIHTSHSLGRVKQSRLISAGRKPETVERQFNFTQRIAAEEQTLAHASMIVASSRQEIASQYAPYHRFNAKRAAVIPPGIDLSRFSPPGWWSEFEDSGVRELFERFLAAPRKPIILALCRPDSRKNISALVAAYGESAHLRELANLVIIAGTRNDVRGSSADIREFFTEILLDIDKYDLYGCVAVPKQHKSEDIPEIYRYVARSRGVLVNPSLAENFGLTLIEAAASGLPVVASNDGGPQEIVANCRHGLLIDPLDRQQLTVAIIAALENREQWRRWSRNGITGAARHYTWTAHAERYVRGIDRILHKNRKDLRRSIASTSAALIESVEKEERSPLTLVRQVLITDLDNTLIGEPAALKELMSWLHRREGFVAFGVATGRTLESTLKLLRENRVPIPDLLLTSLGTEIHYGPRLRGDTGWRNHIRPWWRRNDLEAALSELPGLRLQPQSHQTEYKLCYFTDSSAPTHDDIVEHLELRGLRANTVFSHGDCLDVIPLRGSKGRAVRYVAYKWGLPLTDFLVAGDSANDFDMLSGDTLGVVVNGHAPELKKLRAQENVFFAHSTFARGIIEGITHHSFGNGELARRMELPSDVRIQ
jgi:sucrose-phosphate synthase